jgi:hypothetical protein
MQRAKDAFKACILEQGDTLTAQGVRELQVAVDRAGRLLFPQSAI